MNVSIEKDGPVMTIILSRPEVRNAVDRETAAELAEAFREFEADETARVAVFTGDQENFCAGADLKKMSKGQPNRVEPDGDGPMGPTRMRFSKPVIAAISGYAVAGGLELALLCDLRVMEEDAVIGVFNRRWGVPLIDGGVGSPAAVNRSKPRIGFDFNRPTGECKGSMANGSGQSSGPQRNLPASSRETRAPHSRFSPNLYARGSDIGLRAI